MNPGDGYRLLKPGEKIRRGDSYFHSVKRGWFPTRDAGLVFKGQNLVYRRKLTAKSETKVDLGKLAPQAAARATALHMSLGAYVRQCVQGELSRANLSQIQAEMKGTPKMSAWQERHA